MASVHLDDFNEEVSFTGCQKSKILPTDGDARYVNLYFDKGAVLMSQEEALKLFDSLASELGMSYTDSATMGKILIDVSTALESIDDIKETLKKEYFVMKYHTA